MKRTVLTILAFAAFGFTASAQIDDLRTRVGISLEAGIPTGKAGDVYDLAIGGSLHLEKPLAPSFSLTGSAGYTVLTVKDNAGKESPGYIPVKAGAKYYFLPNFYGQGELGASIGAKSGYSTGLILAPGLGLSYPVSERTDFDAGVRYESWNADGGSLDQIAFRVALKF